MKSIILQGIADDMPKIDKNIKDLEDLIRIAEKQGQSTVEFRTSLMKLKKERDSWKRTLKEEGFKV